MMLNELSKTLPMLIGVLRSPQFDAYLGLKSNVRNDLHKGVIMMALHTENVINELPATDEGLADAAEKLKKTTDPTLHSRIDDAVALAKRFRRVEAVASHEEETPPEPTQTPTEASEGVTDTLVIKEERNETDGEPETGSEEERDSEGSDRS
jgi:hypothetical protein